MTRFFFNLQNDFGAGKLLSKLLQCFGTSGKPGEKGPAPKLVREEEAGGEAEAPLGQAARRWERSTPRHRSSFY